MTLTRDHKPASVPQERERIEAQGERGALSGPASSGRLVVTRQLLCLCRWDMRWLPGWPLRVECAGPQTVGGPCWGWDWCRVALGWQVDQVEQPRLLSVLPHLLPQF